MPWEDELDSDEGWAKYNRHYWLRDYRGFVEFFFGQIFVEPHSTKQIEDCVGWALETTPETLIAAHCGATLEPEEARELAQRVRCPVLVVHGTRDRDRLLDPAARARGAHRRLARARRRRRPCSPCTRSRHVQPARCASSWSSFA